MGGRCAVLDSYEARRKGSIVSTRFQCGYQDDVWFEARWIANTNDAMILDEIRIKTYSGTTVISAAGSGTSSSTR